MEHLEKNRRGFLRAAGGTVLAAGVAAPAALATASAQAAEGAAATQTRESQAATTPQQALQMLKDGNARFLAGKMRQRDLLQQVKATGDGQFPFAVILGCIDSRAPNEWIFDQGVGDIFNARIAGNFINDDLLGSLEFACAAAGAKLILVIGHTECGAIKGACDDIILGNLTHMLANIRPAVAAVTGFESDRTSSNAAFVQAVANKNVVLAMARIRERSAILRDLDDKGEIAIAGAMYDVRTGQVTFI